MIRCLIVDDEHFALVLLEEFIRQTPGLSLVGVCRSPVRAVETLQSEPVDLLFLDIQMPILSGMGLLKSISRKPVTIFTTAYPQHAHEAFDLDAVDYLLKPFSLERFTQAVEKAREKLAYRAGVAAANLRPEGQIAVRADRKWINIPLDAIHYIEGWKEYVRIYTDTGRIITLESMANLEAQLPAPYFARAHKSFIVARHQVRSMDGFILELANGTQVQVSRSRKKEMTAWLFGKTG
jgi:two-component system, LytTR family, response regulator LytT